MEASAHARRKAKGAIGADDVTWRSSARGLFVGTDDMARDMGVGRIHCHRLDAAGLHRSSGICRQGAGKA